MKFLYIIKYHDKILGNFILELPVREIANTERCFVERVFVIILMVQTCTLCPMPNYKLN